MTRDGVQQLRAALEQRIYGARIVEERRPLDWLRRLVMRIVRRRMWL